MKKRYFLVFLALLLIPIQDANAVNEVTKIIKLTGSLIGTVEDEDFLLPESLTNLNKTITFMSVRHLGDANAKEIYRSWDFINNTALRFHGSNNVPANNIPMDFVAYFVEFTASSDMIVQNGTLIVDGADINQEFIATLSPSVNATNSFFTYDGLNMDHSDLSWGNEEFGIMRVKNDTSWGYEPFNAPNTGNTEVRFSVIDWNNSNFIIQNGTGTLVNLELLDTIVPSPAIDRRHTIILISTQMEDEENAIADEYGATGRINSSNEIEIEREDAVCSVGNCILNYRWELISFPTTFANVTHDQIFKTTTTPSDQTVSTIDIFSPALGNANNSIAIGAVHTPMGLGQARDSSGSAGAWDRNAYTIELINATAVNGTANDARNSATIPYQVIEFLTVSAGQTFDQIITDVATASDQTNLIINKSAVDIGTVIDLDTNMNITKLNSDLASAGDTVATSLIIDIIINATENTATGTDQTNLNITKAIQDVTSLSDRVTKEISGNVTKLITELATASDTVIATVMFSVTSTDTATVTDSVLASPIFGVTILDITTISDTTVITLNVTVVVPPVTGGGGGGAGGSFERLIGLLITSEEFVVTASDQIPSEFVIEVFGEQTKTVTLTDIQPDADFADWFALSPTPDPLEFEVQIDTLKLSVDPARVRNIALDDFVLIVPSVLCSQITDPLTTCFEPILYQVPFTFTFSKGGSQFVEIHNVIIDGRLLQPCTVLEFTVPDFVCDLVDFLVINWWWLAGIFFIFVVLLFLIERPQDLRIIRRLSDGDLQSMSGTRIRRTKKFKKR